MRLIVALVSRERGGGGRMGILDTFRDYLNFYFLFYLIYLCCLFPFIFWLCREACGILASQPGIEPGHSAAKAPSPNHWTARELIPGLPEFLKSFILSINK